MDIYEINDELIETLKAEGRTVQVSLEFKQCPSNAAKVRLIEKVLCEYNRIPNLRPRNYKQNTVANKLRMEGNKFFSSNNYFHALELYNQSICMAENDTENITIGYANRSAVYAEWKMYEVCLENIAMARTAGLPQRLIEKLNKRTQECSEELEKLSPKNYSNKSLLEPKFELPTNPNVPFILNCLEMKESPVYGRYIVTNEDIAPGQLLAIEEPFFKVVLPHLRHQRCAYCSKENHLTLIPCKNCTSVMFCSQECYDQGQYEFHRYECPIIDYLYEYFNKIHLSAIRATIKAYICFGESPAALANYLTEYGNDTVNVFTPIEKYPSIATENQRKFHQIYSLETNQSKRSASDLFQRATVAAVLYHKLIKLTKFKELLKTEDEQNVFLEVLFRFLQISPTNFHSLTAVEIPTEEDTNYGTAAFPFASLINHSCAPNIVRFTYDDTKETFFALRTIKAGEQLLDNYGYHHSMHAVKLRQEKLKFQYNFLCDCVACQKNYPSFSMMPIPKIPHLIDEQAIEKLQILDTEYAKKNLKKICNYLKQFDAEYPCEQICSAQEGFKMCFNILLKNIPFKFQNK